MTVLHFWYLTTKALHREAVKQKTIPEPQRFGNGWYMNLSVLTS